MQIGIQNFTEINAIETLFSAIEKRFHLGVIIEDNKELTLKYKNYQFKFSRLRKRKLIELLELIKPVVKDSCGKYGLHVNMDIYFADLLLSESGKYNCFEYEGEYIENYYYGTIRFLPLPSYEFLVTREFSDINGEVFGPGSLILKVNMMPCQLLTAREVEKLLFERKDSIIKLSLLTKGKIRDVSFKYKSINTNWYDYFIIDKTCYIKFVNINFSAADTLESKLINDSTSFNQILIDLRGCQGGVFDDCVKFADLFLPEDLLLAEYKTTTNILHNFSRLTNSDNLFPEKKISVLIDDYTASGALIVSHALREYRKSKIYGKKAMCSGAVQKKIPIDKYFIRINVGDVTIANNFSMTTDCLEPDIYLNNEEDLEEIIKIISK